MERNVFLENELEVKNKLVVVVQRLKDELRDLQLEVSVLRSSRASTHTKRRSLSVKPEENSTNPVRMVQEMLGRVKSLESRLVNCRSLVTPLLTPPPSYSSTASSSPVLPGIKKPVLSSSASTGRSTPAGRATPAGGRSLPASPVASYHSTTSTSHAPSLSPSKIPGSPKGRTFVIPFL
ncbi:hypothetical protein SYNPS1DRAFT_31179 [Syncephalis pseudoplumigaleata]|uniref:NUDE domain-containing protein n=1 Tax=Syncephalis pseudoplumigaleata TaxID=1712513 RepID=A0A4P9YUP7_9FUNG|nr:hypothetical protein SYNPS1DRAFT_31179 [Syncephalis pseudoplumigaleata]|eukprot:RKP23122.1 hypothetical protein SYNPS1DRAFT_31179 [Syncephalis pseudoplumigaleata]